jgi:tetratricopeptide (TPR) repeat protein
MSKTLNLAERLLCRARNYQQFGRNYDALQLLGRLAGLRNLPAPIAEETQIRLAELFLARRKYNRARRHLTAALVHQPNSADYHYLMATALAGDEQADKQRALEHFRRSLELDPQQPERWVELGSHALRLGQIEEGLKCLHRALELAPDDPIIVGKVVEGLQEQERADEPRAILIAAMFRNPRDARFRRLWNDFQFERLKREQDQSRQRRGWSSEEDHAPMLLPFVRPPAPATPERASPKIIRQDAPAPPPAPHNGQPTPVPNRRHA